MHSMVDRQTDLIEKLFDAIVNDPTMPAELKILLMRLQLPLHKLSLNDPHFLSNEKHPARQTLFIAKRLSHFAKTDESLLKTINLIFSDLIKATPNSISFTSTNQRLEMLAQTLESPDSEQLISPQKSTDELKIYLNNKIRICLHGHQVPAECKTLVLRLWPSALLYLLKSHGEESPHWINATNMYCDLLSSIQPVLNIEQYRELNDKFMSLVRDNHNTLLLYHQENKVEPAIKNLINHYNHLLGNIHSHTEEAQQQTRTVLEKISSLPEDIKPGVWCEIYIDDTTPPRRLKLSIIHIETGMLIFVNRKGVKKLVKDAYDFSREIKKGLSKAYKHDQLFTKPVSDTNYKKIG